LADYNYLYTSTDSGLTWTARMDDAYRFWRSVASSADGSRLVAAVRNGFIYINTGAATTTGASGRILGGPQEAIELQYVGNDTFRVLSFTGQFAVQ